MQINKQGTPNQQIALTLSDSHCSHLNPHVDRLETATNSVCKKKKMPIGVGMNWVTIGPLY